MTVSNGSSPKIETIQGFLIPVILITLISLYMNLIWSPIKSSVFMYDDPYHFFIQTFKYMFAGWILFYGIVHLASDKWFNRIGSFTLIGSFGLLIFMTIAPNSMVPFINGKQYILNLQLFTITPSYFFSIGIVWLIAWLEKSNFSLIHVNMITIIMMTVVVIIMKILQDTSNLIVLELLLIGMIFVQNGISKILLGVTTLVGLYFTYLILTSSYYLNKLLLITHQIGNMSISDTALTQIVAHVGWALAIITIGLFITIAFYLWKLSSRIQNRQTFIRGIALIVIINLSVNVFYTFSIFPTQPPFLLLFGPGASEILSFFLMIGLVFMLFKSDPKQSF